jgi:hypothetical protein
MGFTTPAQVNSIVLSQIGGMPQMPATSTMIEGRIVTPQIASVCSLGESISGLKGQISDALHNFMQGLDDTVINPLKDLGTAALAAINAVLSYIQTFLTTASDALQAAIALCVTALNAATAAITTIIAHVGNMIGDGLQQIMGSLSACQPAQSVPAAKSYGMDELASSLKQQPAIQDLQIKANSIQTVLLDTNMSETQKITALSTVTGGISTSSTTLNNAVTSDQNNLAQSQLQNQGLGKMTSLANALNNPSTADFANAIINPARSGLINGLAGAMVG